MVNCTKKVVLSEVQGGWGASENLGISLFPNLPGNNWEDHHKVVMMTIPFCFFDGLKEIQLMIRMDAMEVPTLHTEGALKKKMICV
jgi:hypothetical protein